MKKILTIIVLLIFATAAGTAFCVDTTPVELNVKERILLKRLVPTKANLTNAIIALDISKKIDFTQEEIELYDIRNEGAVMYWDADGMVAKEITFTYLELEMLKGGVLRHSKNEEIQVTEDFVNLCKKIKGVEWTL